MKEKKGKFEVQYFSKDNVFKQISETKARKRLAGYYKDVDLIVKAMKSRSGKCFRTAFAAYRWKADKPESFNKFMQKVINGTKA